MHTYIALLLTLNLLQNLTILIFVRCVVCFCDGGINDNFRFDEICFNKPFYSLCIHFMCSRNSLRIHFLHFILFRSYQFQHKYVIPIEPIHWCIINVKRVRVCLVWSAQSKTHIQKKSVRKKSAECAKSEKKFVWKWIVLIFAGHNIGSACVRIIDKINPWQANYIAKLANHSILFRECDMATSHPTSSFSLSFCICCSMYRLVHLNFDAILLLGPLLAWYHNNKITTKMKIGNVWHWCLMHHKSNLKWWKCTWHSAFSIQHTETVFNVWLQCALHTISQNYCIFHACHCKTTKIQIEDERTTYYIIAIGWLWTCSSLIFIYCCLLISFIRLLLSFSMWIIFHL